MNKTLLLSLVSAAVLAVSTSASAAPLIKDSEAKLPAASGGLATRGITRGPGIKQISPDPSQDIKSPLNLKVAFEPRGGAKIDLSSVKVTYLKSPSVELLDRVKPGLSETGIDLSGAEVPPGDHQIRVSVTDSEGRQSSSIVELKVVK
ncbi:hypothetical protein DLREEDagrD3_14960 [Denitratisoma sp. agr-D3]